MLGPREVSYESRIDHVPLTFLCGTHGFLIHLSSLSIFVLKSSRLIPALRVKHSLESGIKTMIICSVEM